MVCASSPPIRAVRASSQASRAAGASASWADAPPVGVWKCKRAEGTGRGAGAGGGRLRHIFKYLKKSADLSLIISIS